MKVSQLKRELVNFKKIGLGTEDFVYLFTQDPQFARLCQEVFNLAGQGKIELFTTVLAAAEILAKPKKQNNEVLTKAYTTVLLATPGLEILALGYQTAQLASDFQSRYRLSLLEAFHLAALVENKVKVFLTSNPKFQKVEEIKILLLQDFV